MQNQMKCTTYNKSQKCGTVLFFFIIEQKKTNGAKWSKMERSGRMAGKKSGRAWEEEGGDGEMGSSPA